MTIRLLTLPILTTQRGVFAINEYQVLFGRRLRFLRKQREWTQERLAAEARLDRTYVASTERGERNISLENILKLADALEVFPGDLFKFSILKNQN